MGLSRRAYARQRGVSETAVRKAIAAGRIALDADGTIDPDRADAAWGARSDPSQRRGPLPARTASRRPVPASAVAAVQQALRESGAAPTAGGMTFVQARTANEVMKAQERRVRLQKLKGELVDRARAVASVFALARRERDSWVQWPARVAALIAAELQVDPHDAQTVLDKHVRQHLDALAEPAIELR